MQYLLLDAPVIAMQDLKVSSIHGQGMKKTLYINKYIYIIYLYHVYHNYEYLSRCTCSVDCFIKS